MAASPMALTIFALMVSAVVGFAYGQECHVDGNGSFPENTSELWQSFLLPVANMSKLYGEVMIIASQKDMHVRPKDSFKHIKYPTSFQTTLSHLDGELMMKQRDDSRLFRDLEQLDQFEFGITLAMAMLLDHQTDMRTGREPRFVERLRQHLSSVSQNVQQYVDKVGQIHEVLSQVPGVLSELASIERNRQRAGDPIAKPEINDETYIAYECFWRLKLINTIAQEFMTPFFQELSIWLQNIKSNFEMFGKYTMQAAENMTDFNMNLVLCEEFRLRRDIKYAFTMTLIFRTYTSYFESKSPLLDTETWKYWMALDKQDRDAENAVEEIKNTAEENVAECDNQLRSQWKELLSQFSGS